MFKVQLYKNNARALLLCIFECRQFSWDCYHWLQHARAVACSIYRGVYVECYSHRMRVSVPVPLTPKNLHWIALYTRFFSLCLLYKSADTYHYLTAVVTSWQSLLYSLTESGWQVSIIESMCERTNNNNNISICIAPFARGYKALLPIITVSGKLSQSFRFT